MESKVESGVELRSTSKINKLLFGREDKYPKIIIFLLILSLIAGIETTLLLYSADQKGMVVLSGLSMSELGMMNFIINTIVMGSSGLLVTFIVQILMVWFLYYIFKERPVDVKGICQAVINGGIFIVIGSGVNAIIANMIHVKETTFTSLGLLVQEKGSILFILMAEIELFYILSLIVFGFSLHKLTHIKKKNAVIITLIVALFSLVLHLLTYDAGAYLT